MKVLHVDSAASWRGGQNQVLLTALGMAARGHDVSIACRRGGVLETRARAAALTVHALPFRGDLSPSAALGLRRVLRRLRPDTVMLHDPHALSAGVLAGRCGACRIGVRRVDFALRGPLSRLKYRACDVVVAVSGAIAAVLEREGLPAERIRVVYEGVPARPPMPGGVEALRALGLPETAAVVGNVAALTDHKDHATLLEAGALVVRRRPEARFVILGEGERRAELETRTRALGLADRVVFAGFRDDVDRLLPAFDVFCLSSRLEGLGTSLLDAMCFARPVVATAAGGIPEAVVDGVTGRVVPVRDARALADAIVDVLSDAERRNAMGRAGRERFLERFTADRMVEGTLRVLHAP
ncbi:MAG TPA: glycosyltransferase [Vicinamibacteria bacterium]|nr:glycosyltransferase [Vicinamibacteria bacterium]